MNSTNSKKKSESDPEILAITDVHSALKDLDAESQTRVIDYVTKKLRLSGTMESTFERHSFAAAPKLEYTSSEGEGLEDDLDDETVEGISPVARRWISRNSLDTQQLSALYSLGVDEIDLVAKNIPGASKREKLRNVFLLKGIAAYLGTGVARITYDQLKEAATHYGAYDSPNFAKYIKAMSSEASGSKEGGYTLTARGLTNATEIIKKLSNT